MIGIGGHDVWTLSSAQRRCNWRHGRTQDILLGEGGGAIQSKIDAMDNAVAYATNKTMPAAVMDNLESI